PTTRARSTARTPPPPHHRIRLAQPPRERQAPRHRTYRRRARRLARRLAHGPQRAPRYRLTAAHQRPRPRAPRTPRPAGPPRERPPQPPSPQPAPPPPPAARVASAATAGPWTRRAAQDPNASNAPSSQASAGRRATSRTHPTQ